MKKIIISLITIIILITGSIVIGYAGDEDYKIQKYISEFSKKTGCGNVSIAVTDGDRISIYGDESGLYQIGSMTKAFTGLAVCKLINEGLISEDDKVSDLLPGFTAYYNSEPCDITVYHLITQTSGYTNLEKYYPSAAEGMTLSDWAESISGKELSSYPGSQYDYSNVNYNLLGAIIEKVTAMSYKDYMETEILTPLGLYNTYVGLPDDIKSVVMGSRPGFGYGFDYDMPVYEGRIPAGYFYSNASDMARWMEIWTGTADITDEYKKLVNDVKENLQDEGSYAFGWEVFENGVIGHSGGTPNYSSRIVFSDDEKRGVCVLTNMNVAASTDGLCNGIYMIVSEENLPEIPTDVWTVFDIVFSIISVYLIILILITCFIKQRRIIVVLGILAAVLLAAICITMPLIFGASLKEIMFVWAPVSFGAGTILLTGHILITVIKLLCKKKNEN